METWIPEIAPVMTPSGIVAARSLKALPVSLTELEVLGLNSDYNFADGHAYHETNGQLLSIFNDLTTIWQQAAVCPVPQMEREFKGVLAKLIDSAVLARHESFSICPTASNSIDTVAAWLAMHNHHAGLLEPVFDNLYLIMKRRGVKTQSIQEMDLINLDKLESLIDRHKLRALVIVTPNNPTGFELRSDEFRALCALFARKRVTLVVDRTFRFYSQYRFDDYALLEDSGANWVTIEDTGKTWPTQDMKVSLIAYSHAIAADLRQLYEEIFLCTSNFALALLAKIMESTLALGIYEVVNKEVAKRKAVVAEALSGTTMTFVKSARGSLLPFAWLDCSSTGLSDLELVNRLREFRIALLPGRYFYWNSRQAHTSNVRLSLMKPNNQFLPGISLLKDVANKIQ